MGAFPPLATLPWAIAARLQNRTTGNNVLISLFIIHAGIMHYPLALRLHHRRHSFCKGGVGCGARDEVDHSGDGTATDVSGGGIPPPSNFAMPSSMERSPPIEGGDPAISTQCRSEFRRRGLLDKCSCDQPARVHTKSQRHSGGD